MKRARFSCRGPARAAGGAGEGAARGNGSTGAERNTLWNGEHTDVMPEQNTAYRAYSAKKR